MSVSVISVRFAKTPSGDVPIEAITRPAVATLASTDTLERTAILMPDPQAPLLPMLDPET
ncbi:MAG: hypothetical protein WCE83_02650 [Candidatus Baltobacteraceae bacterium]